MTNDNEIRKIFRNPMVRNSIKIELETKLSCETIKVFVCPLSFQSCNKTYDYEHLPTCFYPDKNLMFCFKENTTYNR